MFRIPWFHAILTVGFVTSVTLWLRGLLWFFLSSLVTTIHLWLKLPRQAADGRQVQPLRPPPHPDPSVHHFILLLWSLGFMFFLAPAAGSTWQLISLLACFTLARPFFGLPSYYFLYALDRFSNTNGRPSWFVCPPRRRSSQEHPFLHGLHHWHPEWSISDSLFWLLMVLLQVWFLLGWWALFSGIQFILCAVDDWIQWCYDSRAFSCNPSSGSLV